MILSTDPPFLLISINKTATTSMDRALDGYFDEAAARAGLAGARSLRRRPQVRKQMRHKAWNRIPYLKHQKASWIKRNLRYLAPGCSWNSLFKFCFVRHPFDRLQSIYRFHTQKLQNVYPQAVEAGSFNAWLRMGGTGSATVAMRAYILNWRGHRLVDFVGRYETLAEDWDEVLSRIGLDPIPLPHVDATRTASTRETSVRAPEDVEVFLNNRAWKGDLDYFGYDL